MSISNSKSKEIGFKLASNILPEIRPIILKYVIVDFLCFIDGKSDNHTTIYCSNNIQAQLLSMTGYHDLLDDIICMALDELDLTLELDSPYRHDCDGPFTDDFINFVTSRSVQFKSIDVWADQDDRVKQFTNPNILKLFEFHFDGVDLVFDEIEYYKIPNNCPYLEFVNYLEWWASDLSDLLDWHLLNKLITLTKFSVYLDATRELHMVDDFMEQLQLTAPSLKQLYLNCRVYPTLEESFVDFMVQANNFIGKYKHLDIKFDISFHYPPIESHWRLDSKTRLCSPLHTVNPTNTKDVDETVH
ncbi:unnamed protein product [Ambrosiozyma monospora]|uniref:Unnamed protein product n=1 Tax=Ambrosiozyma monospora TaxID=43982 RepID=A0ACB5SWE2_AMBMO|nr:unnamed protein product [Ambrosiozyma monospora]